MPSAKLSVDPAPENSPSCWDDDEDPPSETLPLQTDRLARRRQAGELLIVVEHRKDWQSCSSSGRIVSATEYLDSESCHVDPNTIVINLCRGYKYLSIGYYCSLLAEARGQRVFPSVKTINDLSRKAIYSLDTTDLDDALNELLTEYDERTMPVEFSMDIFLGVTNYAPLADLARQIFETFPAPLMRVEFAYERDWHIRAIKVQNVATLNERQEALLAEVLASFNDKMWPDSGMPKKARYHIAVLQNPEEVLPPSNSGALDKFVQAGRDMGIQVSLIEKKDFSHIAEYDALFIRETTAINHHTYLFAKKAESEGLVVIDDPVSILRCTNKVYLADLMRLNGIPTPLTYVLQEDDIEDISDLEKEIGYPMVMKVPDGAFSRGVSKVGNRKEFDLTARSLLKQSSLILVQEYLYTEFDWRIGVLNKQAIFASQYFMSKDHWQVAKRDASGKAEFGAGCAVPLDEVPADLLEHAVKAASLIGNGLYGVDMKMTKKGPVIIEVNDNPNIDMGIEDGVLGDELYRIVLQEIVRRLGQQHQQAAYSMQRSS